MCIAATLHSPKGLEQRLSLGTPMLVVIRPTLSFINSNAFNGVIGSFNSVSNASGYYVVYGSNSGIYQVYIPIKQTNFTVNGLKQNLKYYFAIMATNKTDRSDFSDEVSIILPISFNTITINWNPTNRANLQITTNLQSWITTSNVTPPYTKLRDKKQEFFRIKL